MTNKLYCTVEDHPEYLESVVRFTRTDPSTSTSIHPIAGHDVVALSPTPVPTGKRFIREVTPPILLRLAKRMLQ